MGILKQIPKAMKLLFASEPGSEPLPAASDSEAEASYIAHSLVNRGRLWELFAAATKLSDTRLARYKDYKDMEKEVIIGSAIELYVDDAFQFNPERQAIVWGDDKSKYKKDIDELFDALDVENRLWGWTYNVVQDGDFFLRVFGEPGVGITRVSDDYHPSSMYRLEMDGALAVFVHADMQTTNNLDNSNIYDPWDFVHFMNNYRPTFEKIQIKVKEQEADAEGNPVGESKTVIKTLTGSYGTSVLCYARKPYKVLNLLEKSLALARLARSPLMRIFYVNTEGLTPKERSEMLDDVMKKMQNSEGVDLNSMLYDSDYNPMSFSDDMFVPTSGSVGDIRAEQLGGDVDIKNIVDIDYAKNKLFAGLRIPKAFLGWEESLPGSLGSTTLTRLDIRYARTAKKVQKAMIRGLYRLVQIHLALKYKITPDIDQIKISCSPISGAEEDDRAQVMERKLNLAMTLAGLLREMEGKITMEPVLDHIFKHILDLPGLDIKKVMQKPKVPEDQGGGGGYDFSAVASAHASLVEAVGDQEACDKIISGNLTEGDLIGIVEKIRDRLLRQKRELEIGKVPDLKAAIPEFENEIQKPGSDLKERLKSLTSSNTIGEAKDGRKN